MRIQQKLKNLSLETEPVDDEVEEQPEANMKLITEEIETLKVLVEEKDGKKSMFIEGVFLQGNLKNRNGRFYPVETLEREVARYNEAFVGKGRSSW